MINAIIVNLLNYPKFRYNLIIFRAPGMKCETDGLELMAFFR